MQDLEIQITKSWRKSLSMRFDTHGVLQVRAPKFLLPAQIDAFIQKNTAWIEKHYTNIQKQSQDKKYYLFGEVIDPEMMYNFWRDRESSPQKLERFYKSEAKKYLKTRTTELANMHKFDFDLIKITSAKTRWGSCSSNKTINFTYRLIMAPKEAIEYVIIHELCHLRQMNHGPRFWKEVANIMPDYHIQEKHLKDEGWRYRI